MRDVFTPVDLTRYNPRRGCLRRISRHQHLHRSRDLGDRSPARTAPDRVQALFHHRHFMTSAKSRASPSHDAPRTSRSGWPKPATVAHHLASPCRTSAGAGQHCETLYCRIRLFSIKTALRAAPPDSACSRFAAGRYAGAPFHSQWSFNRRA
jgi:hypothetical protein